MAARKLTPRQAAVLAAIERRGRATLLDLRDDFPDIAPSTVARVTDVLRGRELIRGFGDPSLIYAGGVEFVATRRAEPPSDLDAVVAELRATGLTAFGDRDGRHATVLLPVVTVQDQLTQTLSDERKAWDALAEALAELDRRALVAWIDIDTELSAHEGVPALQVRVGLDVDDSVFDQDDDTDFSSGEPEVPA